MHGLLDFIVRNGHWIIAIFLIVFSFYLLFSKDDYHKNIYLSSANKVTGSISKTANEVNAFFALKGDNRELLQTNIKLLKEIDRLQAELQKTQSTNFLDYEDLFIADSTETYDEFEYIPAEVAGISFMGMDNFITLNKGKADGVAPDMGVLSAEGVVGVVAKVSDHFSQVIPIINKKFRLSARLKSSENLGSLAWNGKSIQYAQLQYLPKHEVFHSGDTVVTGFSNIFPKNIIIGLVNGVGHSGDDSFNTFEVKIAVNFRKLQNVAVIKNNFIDELKDLEKSTAQ